MALTWCCDVHWRLVLIHNEVCVQVPHLPLARYTHEKNITREVIMDTSVVTATHSSQSLKSKPRTIFFTQNVHTKTVYTIKWWHRCHSFRVTSFHLECGTLMILKAFISCWCATVSCEILQNEKKVIIYHTFEVPNETGTIELSEVVIMLWWQPFHNDT